MNRQEQYNKMLDEDNDMLVEENEILRVKLNNISNFIDKTRSEVTESIKKMSSVDIDYFVGQRSILNQIKKML